MISVTHFFSPVDKDRYRKIRPVRKMMRGMGLEFFPNQAIIYLLENGFQFTPDRIKFIKLYWPIQQHKQRILDSILIKFHPNGNK